MNTLLDFTPEQLAFQRELTDREWREVTARIVELEVLFAESIEALYESPKYQDLSKDQGIAALWLTQIDTALLIVKNRQAITDN